MWEFDRRHGEVHHSQWRFLSCQAFWKPLPHIPTLHPKKREQVRNWRYHTMLRSTERTRARRSQAANPHRGYSTFATGRQNQRTIRAAKESFKINKHQQGLVNVPIKHHPTLGDIPIPSEGFKGGTPVIHFNVAEEKSHLCLSNAMENSPLKEIIYPQRSPRLTHGGGVCFFPSRCGSHFCHDMS